MRSLTAGQLLALLDRAHGALATVDGQRFNALLADLSDAAELVRGEIGASHMGSGADEVLIERPEDVPTCPECTSVLTDRTTINGAPSYCDECDREVVDGELVKPWATEGGAR